MKTLKIKKGRDVLGNEIKEGDYIVYGAAKGRCAGLNIGRVKEAKGTGRIRASGVVVSWGKYAAAGTGWGYADNPKRRDVFLAYPERICVIPESSVSAELKELLS